jgi:hypothetical protein
VAQPLGLTHPPTFRPGRALAPASSLRSWLVALAGAARFSDDLISAARQRGDVVLADLDRLYQGD